MSYSWKHVQCTCLVQRALLRRYRALLRRCTALLQRCRAVLGYVRKKGVVCMSTHCSWMWGVLSAALLMAVRKRALYLCRRVLYLCKRALCTRHPNSLMATYIYRALLRRYRALAEMYGCPLHKTPQQPHSHEQCSVVRTAQVQCGEGAGVEYH